MITHSPQETKNLAARLAKTLRGGEVIALSGELGSGKTTFVQGLARALGVRKPVRSPTFILVQTFPTKPIASAAKQSRRLRGRSPWQSTRSPRPLRGLAMVRRLCHVDAYRLNTKTDPGDLGLHDYMGKSDTVTVIEWPERIKNILPPRTIWIRFAHGKKEDERIIQLRGRPLPPS